MRQFGKPGGQIYICTDNRCLQAPFSVCMLKRNIFIQSTAQTEDVHACNGHLDDNTHNG